MLYLSTCSGPMSTRTTFENGLVSSPCLHLTLLTVPDETGLGARVACQTATSSHPKYKTVRRNGPRIRYNWGDSGTGGTCQMPHHMD